MDCRSRIHRGTRLSPALPLPAAIYPLPAAILFSGGFIRWVAPCDVLDGLDYSVVKVTCFLLLITLGGPGPRSTLTSAPVSFI